MFVKPSVWEVQAGTALHCMLLRALLLLPAYIIVVVQEDPLAAALVANVRDS